MSKQNVDLVRGVWAAFEGLDLAAVDWDSEAIKEMVGPGRPFSSDVELRWSDTGPENTVYRGRDGLIQAFRDGWSRSASTTQSRSSSSSWAIAS